MGPRIDHVPVVWSRVLVSADESVLLGTDRTHQSIHRLIETLAGDLVGGQWTLRRKAAKAINWSATRVKAEKGASAYKCHSMQNARIVKSCLCLRFVSQGLFHRCGLVWMRESCTFSLLVVRHTWRHHETLPSVNAFSAARDHCCRQKVPCLKYRAQHAIVQRTPRPLFRIRFPKHRAVWKCDGILPASVRTKMRYRAGAKRPAAGRGANDGGILSTYNLFQGPALFLADAAGIVPRSRLISVNNIADAWARSVTELN